MPRNLNAWLWKHWWKSVTGQLLNPVNHWLYVDVVLCVCVCVCVCAGGPCHSTAIACPYYQVDYANDLDIRVHGSGFPKSTGSVVDAVVRMSESDFYERTGSVFDAGFLLRCAP
jgi:hypothetical protein